MFAATHEALYQFTGQGLIKDNFAIYTQVSQTDKLKRRYKKIEETKISIVAKQGSNESDIQSGLECSGSNNCTTLQISYGTGGLATSSGA